MTGCVALLRSVNVGGHNRVPMAELRDLFAELGFPGARTHLNSGNVIFDVDIDESTTTNTAARLRDGIADRFAVDTPVLLRTRSQLDAVLAQEPFDGLDFDPARLAVVFADPAIDADTAALIKVPAGHPERAEVCHGELLIHYPNGLGKSTLTAQFWRPLKNRAITVRNWRTVTRLRDMLTGLPVSRTTSVPTVCHPARASGHGKPPARRHGRC